MWDRKDTRHPFPNITEPAMENKPSPVSFEGFVNIGPSIYLKGEIHGAEDLVIEGEIEGKINLKDHSLHFGPKSRVNAEIYAKSVTIEGDIRGDVYASERLVIKKSGRLNGNIVAPRLVLEDGARFKGTIDMEKTIEPPKSSAKEAVAISAVPAKDSQEKSLNLEVG